MKRFIAERKLLAESKETGLRKDVVVRIGVPYWVEENEMAACPIEWDGLIDKVADAPGIDLLHALQVASNIDPMINILRDQYTFYWASGEIYETDAE
jgi:hypothetical protein